MNEANHLARVEPAPLASLADDAKNAESAWRMCYDALDMARLVSGALHGGLFACEGSGLRLLAVHELDQALLDGVPAAWARADSGLTEGRPYWHDVPPFIVLPCIDGATIRGAVLLAWDKPGQSLPSASALALAPMGRVLAAVLRLLGVSDGIVLGGEARAQPVAPVAIDPQALALSALLHEHEWNVSSVARALGVTRPTVYSRMRAANLPRLHGRPSSFASVRHRARVPQKQGVDAPASAAPEPGALPRQGACDMHFEGGKP